MQAQTGYLESLTENEREVMLKVKQYLQEKHEVDSPKVWNRWFILRFCRARKFDFVKIAEMIDKYFAWKKEVNHDAIGEISIENYRDVKNFYSHGYYGIDKKGRPIYIEQVNSLRSTDMFAKYTDEQLSKYYMQSYERMLHIIFPECSRVAGRRIDSSVAIMDLKDANLLKLFSGKIKAFMMIAINIAQDFYPECLGSMYIINAGFFFSGCWAVVKGWVDPKTQQKINVISGKGRTELAQIVEFDSLPKFMGGKGERPLIDDHGPWENELHNSYQNKTVFHSDRSLIRKYYWTKDEEEEYKDRID